MQIVLTEQEYNKLKKAADEATAAAAAAYKLKLDQARDTFHGELNALLVPIIRQADNTSWGLAKDLVQKIHKLAESLIP
jgi:hypothetical protein